MEKDLAKKDRNSKRAPASIVLLNRVSSPNLPHRGRRELSLIEQCCIAKGVDPRPAHSQVSADSHGPAVVLPAIMCRMDGARERVEALRKEITELQTLNLSYLQTARREDLPAMDAQERREQRSKEIMWELESMTAWKKM